MEVFPHCAQGVPRLARLVAFDGNPDRHSYASFFLAAARLATTGGSGRPSARPIAADVAAPGDGVAPRGPDTAGAARPLRRPGLREGTAGRPAGRPARAVRAGGALAGRAGDRRGGGPGRAGERAQRGLERFARRQVRATKRRPAGNPSKNTVLAMRDGFGALQRELVGLHGEGYGDPAVRQWTAVPRVEAPDRVCRRGDASRRARNRRGSPGVSATQRSPGRWGPVWVRRRWTRSSG